MSYFEKVLPTYIERWPVELRRLSMESIPVPISLDEARSLGRNIIEWGECFGKAGVRDAEAVERIEDRIHKAAVLFRPGGAFVRLGSRSPKDSYEGNKHGFKVLDGKRAIKLICDVSERMSDDLQLAIAEKYPPTIWVRQFIEMGFEARCFIDRHKLISAVQYFKNNPMNDADERKNIVDQTVSFIVNKVIPVLHITSAVVDISIWRDRPPMLIEINPFFELTDPIMMSWSRPDEMRSQIMRFSRSDGVVDEPLSPPRKYGTSLNVR